MMKMKVCANGHEITDTACQNKVCPECKIIRLETELADKETQFGLGLANWEMRCKELEMEINDMSAGKDMLKGQILDLNQVIFGKEKWIPTPENVNILPEGLRRYVHDLETATCSELVQDNAFLRETVEGLKVMVERQPNEKKCEHKNTHYEDWPDGGAIEVCEDCDMSRHHWEWGESSWIMVKDIEQARKEIQKGIDEYLTEKITDENEIEDLTIARWGIK